MAELTFQGTNGETSIIIDTLEIAETLSTVEIRWPNNFNSIVQ